MGKRDVQLWKPDAKGTFTVKSSYNVLIEIDNSNGSGVGIWQSFWDPSIPPRVLVFCWLARKEKILTIDKLRRRIHFIVNNCPMCLRDEETVDICLFIVNLLTMFEWLFLLGLIFFRPCLGHWKISFKCKFACGRILWKLLLYAFLWKAWLERNNRIFKNKGRTVEEIVEISARAVSELVSKTEAF